MDLLSRCKKRVSDENGYTLAELIITFTLTGIFLVCGITVLFSCVRICMQITAAAQAGMTADLLLETLESELAGRTGEDVQIEGGSSGNRIMFRDTSGDWIQISISPEGRLIRTYETADGGREEPFYAEETYQGMKVTKLWFELPEEGVLRVRLTLMDPKTGKEWNRSRMILYVL